MQDDNEFHIPYESMTLEEILDLIRRGAGHVNGKHNSESNALKTLHSRLSDEIDGLTQDFIGGLIGKEEYIEKHLKLSKKRSAVLRGIAEYDSADDDHCEFLIRLMKNVYKNVRSYKSSIH